MKTARRVIVLAVLVALVALAATSPVEAAKSKRVLAWMCLERCGGNSSTISYSLKQVSDNRNTMSAVAFECYNLGPNSTLVLNNLTIVAPTIQSYGLETWPMVSSYPYPPEFLDWMRQVFANPQPFIDSCIAEAQKWGYSGFNIDWEPTAVATAADAQNYANFLTTLTNSLHQHNLKVSADVASWNSIWNFTLLAESSVDYLLDMDTYTGTTHYFLKDLQKAINIIGLEKLGVGLQMLNPNTNTPLPKDQVEARVKLVQATGAHEIDIWDMPLPDYWWPILSSFVSSP